MMSMFVLFAAGFVSWTISTLAGGGGSVLLVALLNVILSSRAVAPVVSIVSLVAGPVRMAVFWNSIEWDVVRWYVPGGVCGAALGGWMLSRVPVGWLDLLIALFLLGSAWQYRLGERPYSFRMSLPAFVPLSFVVGTLSALIGASGLIASPFYLNHGLIKESFLATRAANSLAIQLTKIVTYIIFGTLSVDVLRDGLITGIGAGAAVLLSRPLLDQIDGARFRRFTVVMMAATGVVILWRRRELLGSLLG
jgi:uncharacterized membrane protein YfcA